MPHLHAHQSTEKPTPPLRSGGAQLLPVLLAIHQQPPVGGWPCTGPMSTTLFLKVDGASFYVSDVLGWHHFHWCCHHHFCPCIRLLLVTTSVVVVVAAAVRHCAAHCLSAVQHDGAAESKVVISLKTFTENVFCFRFLFCFRLLKLYLRLPEATAVIDKRKQ